ncbi:hypothetical protein CHGG_07086 [Chaetomium globosum CBS 148.51]|uniref:Uncharacterized protein n=1 Tax=Chaetomium globosum (strain ATCC 6205 / CBS 148.51 / DSM 1962 / NBRC 6347 / NRRL 1970) TaxID=306901 RepID=Q2GY68_CHAGB|nr:uncharacterized protein CHGG_07086 [Chaetomium globosum CBS 148.51]EAQ85833.1 hypothetical protein CHGG_07086 [Chaetomium globosum CBS 148.51]
MGIGSKKRRSPPPLPAPTETNSTIMSGGPSDYVASDYAHSDLGTDVSRPGDDKSTYSLPDDGTPVTIRTGHRQSKSQTSLLIEYFEGGKTSSISGTSSHRKPSVRVRVRPSSKHRSKGGSDRDRIKITQTKARKLSPSRRSVPARSEVEDLSVLSGDMEDAGSYASATEESNVSRNPIDIEIERSGNARRRRPASPLIPTADSKASYNNSAMSEISAIPADSFLDGSGPATSFGMSEAKSTRSRSPSRTGDYLLGAAAGLGAAAVADKVRNKSRDSRDGREDRERDRVVVSKNRDKDRDRDRKHRSSKSRTSSVSKDEKYSERAKSPRRRSKGHSESLISGVDSSVVSAFAPSHRSMDQHSIRSGASKTSSINNPKLLETVEDAIRRLILPELNALKREQSRRGTRRDSTTSSATTISRDEFANDRRRSGALDKSIVTPRDSMRSKESRDREARNDFDDSSALSHDTIEDHDLDDTPGRSTDRLKAAATGAAMGAAAIAAHEVLQSPSDDKQRSRRRRRAEMRSRGSDLALEDEESELGPPIPPMPLMSEMLASDVTRASILTAETDRPHSASEELAPSRELPHDQLSSASTPTPTKTPITLQQSLGTQHANISHGDLKTLPHQRTGQWDEYIIDDNGKRVPSRASKHYQGDEDEVDDPDSGPAYAPDSPYDYYSTQDVPPPLKYVPYQPERRGLSPIPSISGYTETGSEIRNPESRASHRTNDSIVSAGKPSREDGPTNREIFDDDRSVRNPGMNPTDSELGGVPSRDDVRAVNLNPDFVHPAGIESNVASLVDGSMLEGSALTGSSSAVGNQLYNGRESMATLDEEVPRDPGTPAKRSVGSRHDYPEEREATPTSGSHRSREFVEYELDEYGQKVPQTTYRQSPTMSEAAITSAAVGAAAAVLRAQNAKGQQVIADDEMDFQGAGVQRNKSFKERTQNGPRPGIDTASAERLVHGEEQQPKLGFSGLPDLNDPMPEIGWQDDDDLLTNPSLLGGEGGRDEEEHWAGDATPRQRPQHHDDDVEYRGLDGAHLEPELPQQRSGQDLAMTGAAAALSAAAGMAAAQSHSRQPSQEHDEWYRTSEDKKRDTLVTNPYEGSSPIANIPGLNTNLLPGFDNSGFGDLYGTRSPMGHKVDEGYISQGPNKTPDLQGGAKGKGVDFNVVPGAGGPSVEDPFYNTPKHTRQLSGMSQGMGSPMYDAATGTGIERIESTDIIALMQHLMVRDAQRSARDTEILVTLVRSATEMRNNFEEVKRLLADTEDVIITEVKENTEKTVQRAINGPRPYPGSAPRSIQGGSQAGTINGDDINNKRRSIFRRALKGLSAKGANDLGRIEDMLMQLLTEVDVLKAQTAPGIQGNQSTHNEQLYDHMEPEIQSEQDHGYEPDGMAGTSTASHASQSGYLSIQSRGTSVKPGYDRKVSAHRISTVPEDNEEEYDHGRRDGEQHLMTPVQDQRGSSVPLATPPAPAAQAQALMSNENTPKTEESGKKKSRSSWFRIPKISRWSETTTSSGVQTESPRHSKQSSKDETAQFPTGPSRSGSLDHYQDNYQFAPPQAIQTDKLHTGFSETDLPQGYRDDQDDHMYGQTSSPSQPDANWVSMNMTPENPKYMTPEDPKYKAHRDSLNLVHPQPRQGQTERFKAALESQALGFDSSLGPKSDWAGSVTSLHRFGQQQQQQQQHTDNYGSPGGDHHYQQQHWTSSPAAAASMTATSGGAPPPPTAQGGPRQRPPANKRLSKLQKKQGSPLPHHSVESGYGTMTHGVPTASYISQSHHSHHSAGSSTREGAGGGASSPRLENRNLSGALLSAPANGVNRRPSGPRPMTPTGSGSRGSVNGSGALGEERDRRRDTFGSQDTETF